eukprot:CAMPEP_0171106374 /NCGR_PEP_ID=MMETSP0766_2-20121228/64633_1 /TAXON_ID=439317 /ORGANISM="Gambierdiscus australes, Strain CAWD 149" /LENGTH=148 /DNA_ID=CAMNT_0011567459 /DNA_START=139 /DNA_END=586 /DNA_ORIENTATION=-
MTSPVEEGAVPHPEGGVSKALTDTDGCNCTLGTLFFYASCSSSSGTSLHVARPSEPSQSSGMTLSLRSGSFPARPILSCKSPRTPSANTLDKRIFFGVADLLLLEPLALKVQTPLKSSAATGMPKALSSSLVTREPALPLVHLLPFGQ